MLRNRMFIVLGGCFLAASAACADGVAYVDCASHSEVTPVFGKPRRTPETVAGIPCGERFTILQNGFIFSRIQTKDGQVGYVYSSLITPDRSGATVQQPSAARTPAPPATPPTTAVPAQPSAAAPTPAPVQVQAQAQAQVAAAASIPPAAAPAPVAAPKLLDATRVTEVNSRAAVTPDPAPSTPASAQSTAPEAPSAATAPSTPTPDTQAPTASTAIVDPNAVSIREAPAAAEQPESAPAAAQPAAAVRAVNMKESWEKPNPVAHTVGARNVGMPRLPLIELFGGFGYARLDNGAGTISNSNGVLGSFGWNIKPWLQVIADSSYNRVTVSGTKNVLYGNHWGVRYFRRLRHSWGAAPFVEGLIGGSRADTTVSGTGGYSTSNNCLSYKVGGGVDIHPLKHFEIRVVDFDYYRTSFGTNLHQNNYFISTGIVMRLFGRSEE
jgi:hypothetical protein